MNQKRDINKDIKSKISDIALNSFTLEDATNALYSFAINIDPKTVKKEELAGLCGLIKSVNELAKTTALMVDDLTV